MADQSQANYEQNHSTASYQQKAKAADDKLHSTDAAAKQGGAAGLSAGTFKFRPQGQSESLPDYIKAKKAAQAASQEKALTQ